MFRFFHFAASTAWRDWISAALGLSQSMGEGAP
jgi:hypothetical protein